MKNELNFTQALEVVEKFMTESGIRQYCTEICKGHCCAGCHGTEEACNKNEGRRLSCSMFICANLADRLSIFDKFSTLYYHALRTMTTAADKLMCRNVYFNPWSEEVRNKFRILNKELSFFMDQHIINHIKFSFINRGFEIVLSNPTFRPHMILNNKTGRPKELHENN